MPSQMENVPLQLSTLPRPARKGVFCGLRRMHLRVCYVEIRLLRPENHYDQQKISKLEPLQREDSLYKITVLHGDIILQGGTSNEQP